MQKIDIMMVVVKAVEYYIEKKKKFQKKIQKISTETCLKKKKEAKKQAKRVSKEPSSTKKWNIYFFVT